MKKRTHGSVICAWVLVTALLLSVVHVPVQTHAAELTEIAITFPEPAPGASASDVPELRCSLPGCELEWMGYNEVGIDRADEDAGEPEKDFTGNFEANHAYLAMVNLYLPEGDTFGDDCNITVNGTRLYNLLDDRAELSTYTMASYGDFSGAVLTYLFIPGSTGAGSTENSSTEATPGKTDATTEVTTPGKTDATAEVTTPGKTDTTTEAATPGKTDASGSTGTTTEAVATGRTDAKTEAATGSTGTTTEAATSGKADARTETATGSTGTTTEAAKTESTTTNPSGSKASLTVKASKSSLKRSKKKQTVKLSVSTNSSGKISYSAASNSKKLKKYISVSKKGVVTFKKNAPKGTYKIKVTVAAKDGFKSVSKTVKIKIK